MRRFLLVLVAIFIIFIFELNLFNLLIFRIKPDFLLIAIVFFSIFFDFGWALFVAIAMGFLKDCFSMNRFGSSIFSYMICVILVVNLKKYFYRDNIFMQFISLLILSSIILTLEYFTNNQNLFFAFFPAFFCCIIPQSLFTALLTPFAFIILKRCAIKLSV